MANPASQLPAASQAVLNLPGFSSLSPEDQMIFRRWAANPLQPTPDLHEAVRRAKDAGVITDAGMTKLQAVLFGAGAFAGLSLLPTVAATGASAAPAAAGPVGGIPIAYTAGATVPNAGALGTSAVAGAGGASALSKILSGLNTANTVTNAAGKSSLLDKILQGAGLGAAGFNAINSFRNPPANEQLNRILGLSEQRINESAPLFKALNTMALAGLPRYTRGE